MRRRRDALAKRSEAFEGKGDNVAVANSADSDGLPHLADLGANRCLAH